MYTVYIIYSHKLNRYYIGYTAGLEKRMGEHHSGISTFTAKANDWILMHSEVFPTRESAMQREKQIKKKKSRKFIEWLISTSKNIQGG